MEKLRYDVESENEAIGVELERFDVWGNGFLQFRR